VPLFAMPLFQTGGNTITINDVLVFFVILWLIGILPYPFRQIASVLLLLWILSALGVIAIAGFSTIVMVALIFGLIAFIARMAERDV
jgi:hypothetical protein